MNVVLRFLSCAAGCGFLCVVEVILQQVWLVATTIVRVVRVHENLWYLFSYTRGGGSILLRQFQVPRVVAVTVQKNPDIQGTPVLHARVNYFYCTSTLLVLVPRVVGSCIRIHICLHHNLRKL
jgi:hypothetical protein